MQQDCDVVVIGSGAGGATLAEACARAGKSVLLLERGDLSPRQSAPRRTARPSSTRSPTMIGPSKSTARASGFTWGAWSAAGPRFTAPPSCGPAATTSIRAKATAIGWRGRSGIGRSVMTNWNRITRRPSDCLAWPATATEDYGPLQKPMGAYPHEPLPLHPINERLMAANRASGLRPFRLPLAIDPGRCLRCGACAGYVCPTGGAWLGGATRGAGDCGRTPLERADRRRGGALAREWGRGGSPASSCSIGPAASAKRCAAGAMCWRRGRSGRRTCLLRSGIEHPLIGRHYMFHLSPLVVGLFARPHRGGRHLRQASRLRRLLFRLRRIRRTRWGWCRACRCRGR